MKPKVLNTSSEGSNPSNSKYFRILPDFVKSGKFFRTAIADFISKQLLSLFVNFYPLVKH